MSSDESDFSNDEEGDFSEGEGSDMSKDEEKDFSKSKRRKTTADVNEGKTLFIRNLSYESSSESLENLMNQFGPVEYCVLCMNKMTEHPKGTAFVKFVSKIHAEKCLEKAEKDGNASCFYLDGRQLNISLAVSKEKVMDLIKNKKSKTKDKRNLYLAKEGLIYPKSPASEGVSQADLAKRLDLENRKRKLLQNFHYFVSTTRLCVHNLPPNIDDKELRQLFLSCLNDKSARITECRVMKNKKKNEKKFGKSKGFGFIEFTQHNHAIRALRFLNNNPNVFTPDKRPIVEFSIENRIALNKKTRRAKLNEKAKKNQDNKSEVKQQIETEYNYSGVKSKPSKENEKVKAPKNNKKVFEMSKLLNKRGKKLKATKKEKKKKQNIKGKKELQDVTLKRNKKRSKESDELEEKYSKKLKSKRENFTDNKNFVQKSKKKKWFVEN